MLTERQKELIEKKILGTLTDQEKQEFRDNQQNIEFQEEVKFHDGLQQVVESEYREALRETLQNLRKESINEDKSTGVNLEKKTITNKETGDSKTKTRSFHPRWISAVAASLILAVLLALFFFLDSSPTIEHLAWAGTTKGGNNLDYTGAFEAYEDRDYSKAKALFNEIPEEERDDEILLYNAITLLLLNQKDTNDEELDQSIKYLESVSNGNSNNKEVAEWYLAQAYLAKDDERKANDLLRRIAQNPQHPYTDKAEELLE